MDQRRVTTIVLRFSLLLLTAVLLLGDPMAPKAQEAKRFEYRIVEVLPDTMTMQMKLNEFGMNGWELVSVSMGNMTEPRLIFKK